MTDPLQRSLSGAVEAATPDSAPPFGDVLERHARRRRRTRGALAVGAAGAATAAVAVAVAVGGPDDGRTAPPIATDGTDSSPVVELTPNSATGSAPPALVLGAPGGAVDALQGSYCWANGCGDMVLPKAEDAPDVGSVSPLNVAFPRPGQWSINLREGTDGRSCASYPALIEPDNETHLQLTPSGPAANRFASYFVYAAGGDTSGFWRWTVARDGVPLSWMTVTQNSPSSGGMTDLTLVIDDAAVDGDVSAEVTVEAADGATDTFALSEVDQHCDGDGFVELAIPEDTPEQRIDGLGPAPYDYRVDLTVDGQTYTGTGSWSGQGTEHGGDARLTFEPALPALR
ncbi:hypothetical protein [Nocardioides pelophilus]|uniref:hypothetical protein n=1 Tax=Nocardioides pelophilus TaxID=2172019 RepID=UPI0016032C12|nr:hypothetical protein [Nocardioides pelophilus]